METCIKIKELDQTEQPIRLRSEELKNMKFINENHLKYANGKINRQ